VSIRGEENLLGEDEGNKNKERIPMGETPVGILAVILLKSSASDYITPWNVG